MTGYLIKLKAAGWLALVLILCSCTLARQQSNHYQQEPVSTQTDTGPVAELHRKAINALAVDKTGESIEYLQRAIKIEPRNALSWHYLAQSYWRDGNFKKCLAMLERSLSYRRAADDLEAANKKLKQQCKNG